MNNMIATLEIVRFVAAIALCTALFALAVYGLYRNIKETAETAIREELEQAIKEASKPVVKVEIQTKGISTHTLTWSVTWHFYFMGAAL